LGASFAKSAQLLGKPASGEPYTILIMAMRCMLAILQQHDIVKYISKNTKTCLEFLPFFNNHYFLAASAALISTLLLLLLLLFLVDRYSLVFEVPISI
jgi:hypothetical protein